MPKFILEILDGDLAGTVVDVDKDKIKLGRKPGNDVVLRDEKASGTHAELALESGDYVLRDLASTNGTFMDGKRISEVVLSAGDVFQVGKTRVAFRRAGEASAAAAGAGGEDLKLHRIDATRLAGSRRRGGMMGLSLLLLVVLAAGGYVYYRFAWGGRGGTSTVQRAARVAGNLLPEGVDGCEDEAGFVLGAGGVGFTLSGAPRTGSAALEATGGQASQRGGYALAQVKEPLRVLAGESLRVTGHARSAGGASVALRLRFSSSSVEDAGELTTGSTPATSADYAPIEAEIAVPPGMDRAQLEVLALLPGQDAQATVDDLAVTKGGAQKPFEASTSNGVRLIGSGGSFFVNAAAQPVVLAARPVAAGNAALEALDRDGNAVLSDAGATLSVTGAADRFDIGIEGGSGIALELPGLDSPLWRADDTSPFAPLPAEFTLDGARQLLLGSGQARLLVDLGAPGAAAAGSRGERARIAFPGARSLALVVAFDQERRVARESLRQAREAEAAARFGEALRLLGGLAALHPHDDAVLREAQQLRTTLLERQSARLEELRGDVETARFFGARGGLQRAAADLQELVARYGEDNVDAAAVAALRQTIADEASALEREAMASDADGLRRVAGALRQTGDEALADLVADYLKRHGGGN
jgi:hypothetical protein